jgi:AcrR family transcriptional regulator
MTTIQEPQPGSGAQLVQPPRNQPPAQPAPPAQQPPAPSQRRYPPEAKVVRRPGRPRSDKAEEAILDAVLTLFSEGATYDSLSMEMIAAAAGVGKATIYRRWPNKEALVIGAIGRRLHPDEPEAPPGESVREDLIHLLELMRNHLQDQCTGAAYTVLTQLTLSNPNVSRRYHEQVIEPRREMFRAVLRRGVATGELRPDLDVDRAMFMLTSPVLTAARHHVPESGPIDRSFCAGLVDYLLTGVSRRDA